MLVVMMTWGERQPERGKQEQPDKTTKGNSMKDKETSNKETKNLTRSALTFTGSPKTISNAAEIGFEFLCAKETSFDLHKGRTNQ